jgi:hypothetical protein
MQRHVFSISRNAARRNAADDLTSRRNWRASSDADQPVRPRETRSTQEIAISGDRRQSDVELNRIGPLDRLGLGAISPS